MLLVTEAVVLHAFDYLESSRILTLVTRDGGVRSVLARGARRSSRRFGSALDLFAQGTAQLHTRPGRDLDTLGGFDVTRARPELAGDLGRFLGASAISELATRFGREAADVALYDAVVSALDALASAGEEQAIPTALAGAWRMVRELGFAPAVDVCAECHAPLDPGVSVMFSHRAGGSLCPACGRHAPAGRVLPGSARDALRAFLEGASPDVADQASGRAHQRLLREFLTEHLTDGRPLRALETWEEERW